MIAIYELNSLTLIFKATFEDASDQITNLYHLPVTSHENSLGFFALLETKIQTKKSTVKGQSSSKKVMKKVHLVEMQQKEVRNNR